MQPPLCFQQCVLYRAARHATWLALTLTMTLVAGTSVYCAEKNAVADAKTIQGEWKCVESIEEGKTYKVPDGVVWVFADDQITVLLEGRKQHTGQFTLEPSSTPSTIDMKLKGESSANSDADIIGIYKLEKNKLTVCSGTARHKNKRPTAFAYTKEFPTSSVILERVK